MQFLSRIIKIIYLIALNRLSPLQIILPSIFASLIATNVGISDGSSLLKITLLSRVIIFKIIIQDLPEITKV